MISRENLSIPPSMKGYVDRVKETDPLEGIYRNTKQFRKLLNNIPKSKASYAYAPGKWTLKEMLQHIIDAERVFAFRALHIARKDVAPLPGFDENQWAIHSQANDRKWKDLTNEFLTLRNANEMLFATLNEAQLQQAGVANNHPVSVAALVLVTAGHLDHHMQIIRERYLQPYPSVNGIEKAVGKKKKKTADKKEAAGKKAEWKASKKTDKIADKKAAKKGSKKTAKKGSKKSTAKADKAAGKKVAPAKKAAKNNKPLTGALIKDVGFIPGKTAKKKK